MRCVGWADWVNCRCFLSFVFLGDARCLVLSPCNTLLTGEYILLCVSMFTVNLQFKEVHIHNGYKSSNTAFRRLSIIFSVKVVQ